jgi:hypothetical protein
MRFPAEKIDLRLAEAGCQREVKLAFDEDAVRQLVQHRRESLTPAASVGEQITFGKACFRNARSIKRRASKSSPA